MDKADFTAFVPLRNLLLRFANGDVRISYARSGV